MKKNDTLQNVVAIKLKLMKWEISHEPIDGIKKSVLSS